MKVRQATTLACTEIIHVEEHLIYDEEAYKAQAYQESVYDEIEYPSEIEEDIKGIL
jgi:hypothetical protein